METKTCCHCHKAKPLSEFNKRSASSDGYQSRCKACHQLCNDNHYKKNKQLYKDRATKSRLNRAKWFVDLKSTMSCNKCGEDRYWRLDFHHTDPTTKIREISTMVTEGYKRVIILEEIDKCVIVCKNCHADIHHFENSS